MDRAALQGHGTANMSPIHDNQRPQQQHQSLHPRGEERQRSVGEDLEETQCGRHGELQHRVRRSSRRSMCA